MTKKLVSWDDVANALPAVVQASLDSKYAPAGSGGTTSASDLTSGTLAPERIADGSLAPVKVTGTAVTTNDSRLSDARASTWATVSGKPTTFAPIIGSGATQAVAGNDPRLTGPSVSTVTYAATITPNASTGSNFKVTATGNLTLNPPTSPTDGQMVMVEVRASGAARAVTLASGILLTTGLAATLTVASGKSGFIGLRYSSTGSAWYLLASTAEAPQAGPVGPPGVWTPTFSDDFDGTALDPAKWTPTRDGYDYGGDTPFNGPNESAWYWSGNITVADSVVSLAVNNNDPKLLGDGNTYPYSAATLCTINRFTFGAGTYIEARVKVMTVNGGWPAFWSVAQGSWPPEFDIFEFFNTATDGRPEFNYHPEAGGQTGPNHYGTGDYRDSWHVYGMWWKTDGSLIPYLDGVAYPAAGGGPGTVDTVKPQFIILDQAIGSGAGVPANGVAMQVDWVRAWQ